MSNLYFVSSPFGQTIIYIITFIFLLALFLIIRAMVRYALHETDELNRVKDNFRDLETEKAANLHDCYDVLKQKVLDNSIAKQRLSNIYHIARQQQVVKQEEVTDIDILRENATFTSNFLRYARSGMILLGLFGTFFGLTHMVGDMGFVFDQLDTRSIESLLNSYADATSSMQGVINPMQDAFATSFWGLLGTIILSLLFIPFNWYQQQYFANLESFTTTHLIPLFNPVHDSQRLNNLVAAVGQNTATVNTITERLERISNHLVADFEHMHQFTRNLQNSLKIYVEGQNLLHQDITTLNNLVANYSSASRENQNIVAALNLHNVTIDKLHQKLSSNELNVADWLREIIDLTQKQNADFKETLKHLLDLTRSNLSNTQSTVNRFSISIGKFDKSLTKLENQLMNFDNALADRSEIQVDKLNELVKKMQLMSNMLSHIKTDIPAILTQMQQTMVNNNNAANPEYLQAMAQSIAEKQITERLRSHEEAYQKLNKELEDMQSRQNDGIFRRFLGGNS